MNWYSFSEGQSRRAAPHFSLPSSHGGTVNLSDYRGRRNLILFFASHEDLVPAEEALKTLTRHRAEYQAEEAEILGLVPDSLETVKALQARLDLPFPLLADTERRVYRSYAALLPSPPRDAPLLFVLDRYNAPYAALIGAAHVDAQTHREILEWLSFIELQCPE